MRSLSILTIASLGLAACGGSQNNAPPPAPPTWTKPAGAVAVNFSVDDSANKVYKQGDLQWKGSMIYDGTKNLVTKDSTWGGPWATLYDDGPWTTGGHEPVGSTAGDSIWGVTVFVTPPASGADTYEYGLIDNVYQTNFGNGWIWTGSNGKYTVSSGATADVKADGLALKKFGTTDLQITIDKSQLAAGTWDTSKITLKGSGWAWSEVPLTGAGTGGNQFVFTLSENIGAGKKFPHTGLMSSGDKPEFIFVFNGKEYKDPNTKAALATGITAATKASGSTSWTPASVTLNTGNNNTYVTIP